MLLVILLSSAGAWIQLPPDIPAKSFRKHLHRSLTPTTLRGIEDEIMGGAYDLSGGSSGNAAFAGGPMSGSKEAAFEGFLAELVFSPNDPKVDIYESLPRAGDAEFQSWLSLKVDNSVDAEEKAALRNLLETIEEVVRTVELSAQAEERMRKEEEGRKKATAGVVDGAAAAAAAPVVELSSSDVLRRAAVMDTAPIQTSIDADKENQKQAEEERKRQLFVNAPLTPEIRASYDGLLKRIMPPYVKGETMEKVVRENYDYCDAQLLKILGEMKDDTGAQMVLAAIGDEQSSRMKRATESIREVLALGDVSLMEGRVISLAREGKIDESFLLLLEANALQAEQAGAVGPANVMRKLKARAEEEKDKLSGKLEIRLLRRLLRTSSSEEREELLTDAFTPREKILVEGTRENAEKALTGETPEEEKPLPDVPPPDFIACCKAVLLNFGNLNAGGKDENADLSERIKMIASEAEIVATKIYGKGRSAREQQDLAWEKASTSIFDLETMELDEMSRGSAAPWAKDSEEDSGFDMPGFGADGKMRIGGS